MEEEQDVEAEEEQGGQEEEEAEDEGVDMAEDEPASDPIDAISTATAPLASSAEPPAPCPEADDVLMSDSRLHLPGFEEVEALAVHLLPLADSDSEGYLVPADLRENIIHAQKLLMPHDRTARSFAKKYESTWGYTLFAKCLGPESPERSAAQKTKFAAMTRPQAVTITEESRLLYILIKMLRHRPPASIQSSPTKQVSHIRAAYKRITDRVRDDRFLGTLDIPLPNINPLSISSFLRKEDAQSNLRATKQPQVTQHRRVLSDVVLKESPSLPDSLPQPDRPQVQYESEPYKAGKRRGQKRRVPDTDPPQTTGDTATTSSQPTSGLRNLQPKPSAAAGSAAQAQAMAQAPFLLVVPSQPQGPSFTLQPLPSGSSTVVFQNPPPVSRATVAMAPNQSKKPCTACKRPNCGGLRKKYTPGKLKTLGSSKKIFVYCPHTRTSVTPGFQGKVYGSYEAFVQVVDEELTRRRAAHAEAQAAQGNQ